MARVTYLLGAGASAEALPVVANMNIRLEEFKGFLFEFMKMPRTHLEEIPIITVLSKVIAQEKKHYSIDTYARKIFLRGGGEGKEYLKLKAILSCYFLFEQIDKGNYYPVATNPENKELTKAQISITNPLDKRYDAFFASVLDGSKKLHEEIKILSWNYDSQFELSYKDFVDGDMFTAMGDLKVLSSNNLTPGKPNLIKLNGTAFSIMTEEFFLEKFRHYDSAISNFKIDESHRNIFADLFNSIVDSNKSYLNFAWETDVSKDERIKKSKEILSKTDYLVIIGYSFPYYNIYVDKELMASISKIKKIYIQDLPGTVDVIADRLSYFDIRKERIHPVNQADLFFLPPEFFGAGYKRPRSFVSSSSL